MPIQTINGENAMNSINDIASATFTEKQLQEFLKENNYCKINLKCLKILKGKNRNSVKTIISLFTPHIIKVGALKIKTFIMQKK